MRKLQIPDEHYYRPEELCMGFNNLRSRRIAGDTDYQPTVLSGVGKYPMNGIDYFKKHDGSKDYIILKTIYRCTDVGVLM